MVVLVNERNDLGLSQSPPASVTKTCDLVIGQNGVPISISTEEIIMSHFYKVDKDANHCESFSYPQINSGLLL